MEAEHDHSGHDHGDAMAMDHDKYHNSVLRNPDGSYYYAHGAFLGHVVPGCFFIVWGSWWCIAAFQYYLRSLSNPQQPFSSRSWYRWPWAPKFLHDVPLEPILKSFLALVGILGELWLGHESFRTLYAGNRMFNVDHLNDWQHSSMYLAFLTSGVVDILGHCTRLPTGTQHGFLALAFVVQLQLLAFHLKGPPIEFMVHLVLALQVALTVFAVLGELCAPHSIVMASARPFLTILQGVWWIQTAYIMYVGNPAWDPEYMGSTMMGPVVLAVHMLWISFAMLSVLLVMRCMHERAAGRPLHLAAPKAAVDHAEADDLDLEMSSLISHKHTHAP